ncbi:ribosome maturation factor RimP [Alkalibacterium psychrotolerans]
MNTIDKVKSLTEPIAEELGYELVDVEYVKEGKNWFLRLYIDKDKGIDLDDCAIFSEKVGERLDAIEPDPIPHAYYLEVSSPGAERPLNTEEDIKKAIGKYINVKLNAQIDGQEMYEGHLQSFDGETLVMEVQVKARKKVMELPYSRVTKARLAVEF